MNALYEELPIVSRLAPASYSAGTVDLDAIDASQLRRLLFVVQTGVISSNGTVDFKLQQSDASDGTFTDITGKAITTLAQAASGSNKIAIIELQTAELGDGMRYVRGRLTVATAAALCAVLVLGGHPRYAPTTEQDLAAVAEIVH